LDSYRPRRS